MSKMYNSVLGPVLKNQILSGNQVYGLKRTYTVNGKTYNDIHNGIDLISSDGVEEGVTPLLSLGNGKVVYTTENDGTGSKSIVCAYENVLPNGYVLLVLYAHCNKIIKKINDQIVLGDTIAYIGKTGIATGVHVHVACYAIPKEKWITYKWSYDTRDQYVINPNHILGVY